MKGEIEMKQGCKNIMQALSEAQRTPIAVSNPPLFFSLEKIVVSCQFWLLSVPIPSFQLIMSILYKIRITYTYKGVKIISSLSLLRLLTPALPTLHPPPLQSRPKPRLRQPKLWNLPRPLNIPIPMHIHIHLPHRPQNTRPRPSPRPRPCPRPYT